MNEVDNFFNSLPNGMEEQKPFDIGKAISEKETTEEPVSQVAEQDPVLPSGDTEEKLPFGKDPKIQKYIDRQIRKRLEESRANDPKDSAPQKVVEVAKDTSMPAEWIMAYGDSEQSRQAWNFQQKLISDAVRQAKEEALNEVQSSFQKQQEAEKQFENFITTSLESIEDSHDVDITSNSPAAKKTRSEFLELVKNLSPKDSDGNVTEYADFNAAWNVFQSVRQKEAASEATSQKKALSSRSMMKSNQAKSYDPTSPKTPLTFGDTMFDTMFGA